MKKSMPDDVMTKISRIHKEEFDNAEWKDRYRTWTSFVDSAIRRLIDRENRLETAGVKEE